jgi:hypothetical protein
MLDAGSCTTLSEFQKGLHCHRSLQPPLPRLALPPPHTHTSPNPCTHTHTSSSLPQVCTRSFRINPHAAMHATSILFGYHGNTLLVGDRMQGVLRFEADASPPHTPHTSPTKGANPLHQRDFHYNALQHAQPQQNGREQYTHAQKVGRIRTSGAVYAEHRKLVAMAVHRGVLVSRIAVSPPWPPTYRGVCQPGSCNVCWTFAPVRVHVLCG